MPSLADEIEWLEKIKTGDEGAFRCLFDHYRDKLFSFCFRFTKNEMAAEEIVQDVFMKIWVHRQEIDPLLSFNAYLYKITENQALNFLKKVGRDEKLKKNISLHFPAIHNQTEEAIIYHDYIRLMDKAIDALPPQRRLIYKLSRQEVFTHEEIAKKLGISKNTVRNQIIAAIRSIRQYFSAHSDLTLPFLLLLLCF